MVPVEVGESSATIVGDDEFIVACMSIDDGWGLASGFSAVGEDDGDTEEETINDSFVGDKVALLKTGASVTELPVGLRLWIPSKTREGVGDSVKLNETCWLVGTGEDNLRIGVGRLVVTEETEGATLGVNEGWLETEGAIVGLDEGRSVESAIHS